MENYKSIDIELFFICWHNCVVSKTQIKQQAHFQSAFLISIFNIGSVAWVCLCVKWGWNQLVLTANTLSPHCTAPLHTYFMQTKTHTPLHSLGCVKFWYNDTCYYFHTQACYPGSRSLNHCPHLRSHQATQRVVFLSSLAVSSFGKTTKPIRAF